VLALAAAGAGAMIPGFINLDLKPTEGLIVRAGGALAVFVIVFFFNPARLATMEATARSHAQRLRQTQSGGNNSSNVQAGGDIMLTNLPKITGADSTVAVEKRHEQRVSAGDNSVIVQAGRDAVLRVEKGPPNIKLVRVTVEDDRTQGGLKQKINVVIKNTGGATAFLTNGYLVTDGAETIRNCSHIGMQYSLSESDWTYDVDIDSVSPSFVGRHSIAPNEVVNFDVAVGRKRGFEITVYKCRLKFTFDEGEGLETGSFLLKIAGPTQMEAGYQAFGPSAEEWAECQIDNIRRLDRIGYDHRPNIGADSRKYLEAVSPGIFDKAPGTTA
jgi:hypothetical protein